MLSSIIGLHPGTLLGRGMCTFTVYRVVSLIKTALPKGTGKKGVHHDMLMCTVKLQKVVSPNLLPARHTISCSGRQSTFTEKRRSLPCFLLLTHKDSFLLMASALQPLSLGVCFNYYLVSILQILTISLKTIMPQFPLLDPDSLRNKREQFLD